MSKPAPKCEINAIFKQNYAQKQFIAFKIAYSFHFGLRGNLDFPDFLQKKFDNINNRCCMKYFVYFCMKICNHNLQKCPI